MKTVLASRNANKLREFAALLAQSGLELIPVTDFPDVDDVEETGTTFVENARLKAHTVARLTGLPALADDSGLAVDALDGAPGVFSARYSGVSGPGKDKANCDKLLTELADVPDGKRGAAFVCVLVLAWPEGGELVAEGRLEGVIAREPDGRNGFGYDPVFFVPDQGRTAAAMPPETKNSISHRGRAAREMVRLLDNRRSAG